MNNRIKVKICGLTNLDDAEMAVAAGADFVGLVFAESSERKIDFNEAKRIVDTIGNTSSTVGVFQNQDIDYVNSIAIELNLDFIQLHGVESAAYISNCIRPTIKVFQYTTSYYPFSNHVHGIDRDDLLSYREAKFYLLDLEKRSNTYSAVIDQIDCLSRISKHIEPIRDQIPPLFLAGRLTSDNATTACSIIKPYAVDVASGVECSPGKKSMHMTSSFCELFKSTSVSWRGF